MQEREKSASHPHAPARSAFTFENCGARCFNPGFANPELDVPILGSGIPELDVQTWVRELDVRNLGSATPELDVQILGTSGTRTFETWVESGFQMFEPRVQP